MKNNKGFSLVEILATMVIIAIVSTIGIVSINRMIKQSKDHFYESQEQQMVLAAQSYVNDNRNILPRNVGGIIKIKLSTLREKNYLKEDLIDQNKNECDKDKSFVTVYKSSRSEYKYSGYLECPACKQNGSSTCYSDNGKKKPVIDITMTTLNGNQGDRLFEDSSDIKITIKSVQKVSESPNIKIASYSYKIYVNNELKYDSGNKIDNKRQEFTITEKLYKYVPGTVKVVATVTNTDGSTTSKTATNNYSDLQLPSCGRVTYEGSRPLEAYDSQSNNRPVCGSRGNEWINSGLRNVWIVCNDTKELGCAQHEFSQQFNTEGVTDNIVIKDRSGKTQTCPVNKCIDLTTTAVTINVYKRGSKGGKEGKVQQTVTVSKERTANTSADREFSGWVNGVNYPNGVVIEVVLNDSLSNVKGLTWKENKANQKETETLTANQTVKPTSSDKLGTSKTYTATHEITTDGVRKEVITVEDTPGNKMIVNYKIRIDFTKPTCDIDKSHTYTTDGVTLKTSCKDTPDVSGVSYCEKEHTEIKSDKTYNVTDVAGNSNTCRIDVYSQRQEAIRTRSWNTCHHTINTCVGGYTGGCPSNHPTEQTGPIGGCAHNRCCGKEGYDTNCNCRPWSDCKTGDPAKCVADWNDWGKYGKWSNVKSCSAGKYHAAHGDYDHERKCQTLYY